MFLSPNNLIGNESDKTFPPTKNNMHCWDQYHLMKQGCRMIPWMNDEESSSKLDIKGHFKVRFVDQKFWIQYETTSKYWTIQVLHDPNISRFKIQILDNSKVARSKGPSTFSFILTDLSLKRQVQAFLDFRSFDFLNFLFNTAYNSILFSPP